MGLLDIGQRRTVAEDIRRKLANTYALCLKAQGLLECRVKEQITQAGGLIEKPEMDFTTSVEESCRQANQKI